MAPPIYKIYRFQRIPPLLATFGGKEWGRVERDGRSIGAPQRGEEGATPPLRHASLPPHCLALMGIATPMPPTP